MAGPRVRLLGRPAVETADGAPPARPRGRKTWALLARVALADRPPTRQELAALLFPAADDPAAALRWSLADARRALGSPHLLRGDPVSLEPADAWVDLRALQAGTLQPDDLRGALLEGVELRDCPEFESWLVLARVHCAARGRETLRLRALRALTAGDAAAAVDAAERAARDDPLDEAAQELCLRALVAAGRHGRAVAHLADCERLFAREGLPLSAALRTAAVPRASRPPTGLPAGAAARSLLRAGRAALDAGAADGGVETLRRAADDAARAGDAGLLAEVLAALGAALVHAVRGADGEGAVVLHRALRAAGAAGRPGLVAEVLRELAFVDVQAGRHGSAAHALRLAEAELERVDDAALAARVLALQGMNAADLGRHAVAADLLRRSAEDAAAADQPRQRVWSLGVLARSLMLLGRAEAARAAAEASVSGARQHRWHAFLPWPQALRAELAAAAGDWRSAAEDAEDAFASACELGDPCWEGMSARVLGLVAAHDGRQGPARAWLADARLRCDRVPDRYVWVSGYVALAQLQLAAQHDPAAVPQLAERLLADALHADLPEFQAWALVHRAEAGDRPAAVRARAIAGGLDSARLRARVAALQDPPTADHR